MKESESGFDIGLLGFVAVAVVTVLAIAFLSGFFQWLILRQQVDRSGRWVWTTAGGIALGVLVAGVILALVLFAVALTIAFRARTVVRASVGTATTSEPTTVPIEG